jgi:hypothetical protein
MRDWERKEIALSLTASESLLNSLLLRLLSRCSSNDGASPSISGTHGPSTPAKSAKNRKTNGMRFSNRDNLYPVNIPQGFLARSKRLCVRSCCFLDPSFLYRQLSVTPEFFRHHQFWPVHASSTQRYFRTTI